MGDMEKSSSSRRRYATRAEVNRFIDVARSNGITIASLTVSTDGTIRVSTEADAETRIKTTFDTWDEAGRL
jgi:hypothetical protein